MSDKGSLGAMLNAAVKLQSAIDALRPVARSGSELEPALSSLYASFNPVVIELLRQHLNKVSVQLDPKTGSWAGKHTILCVSYGGINIRIRLQGILDLEPELATKVKTIMETLQIVDGQIRSFRNPAEPMAWEECSFENFSTRSKVCSAVDSAFGFRDASTLLARWEEAGLPLCDLKIAADKLEENYRLLARAFLAEFEWMDVKCWLKGWQDIYLEEAKLFIEARRANRTACEVRVPAGETRWGRYSYGVDVRAPDGRKFSIVNSGYVDDERYVFHAWNRQWRNESGNVEFAEFVPHIQQEIGKPPLSVDVESLPDENGYWRWMIYLPSPGWKVSGGSVSYLMTEAISRRAQVSCETC